MRRRVAIQDLSTHPSAFVAVRPLAAYLDVDERTILRMIDVGSLPAIRVGRQWRIATEIARRVFPSSECHHATSGSR